MKWENLKKHELFATKDISEAILYVDDIIGGLPNEHRAWAYTAAYVMYNSVIEHYETNMICTKKEKKNECK